MAGADKKMGEKKMRRDAQALVVSFCHSFFCLSLLLAICAADEPPGAATLHKKWQDKYRSIADSLEMRRGQVKLTLEPVALSYYTNPVRTNDQHGAIFLWTEGGRPAVFGSIWSAESRTDPKTRNVTHEWHSLVEDLDVTTTRKGQVLWNCGEPGIAWLPLAELAPPAASRAARLVQMRAIPRRYSVDIQAEGESDLRLGTQPLYRYPEKTAGAIDGAIFAFGMATDPELLVLVEAHDKDQKPAWHVAFARFGNKAMKVTEGERLVWSCGAGAPGRSEGKYHLFWRAEQMPAEPTPDPRPPTPDP